MSNDLTIKDVTDLSASDLEKAKKFEDGGCPGLRELGDENLKKAVDLYLSGSTYHQVSYICNMRLPMVYYLADKYQWYSVKKEYMNNLARHMKDRTLDAKLATQNLLIQMLQVWQKKLGSGLDKFLASGGTEESGIDLKEIAEMRKVVELLDNLSSDTKPAAKNPAVGLNLGSGAVDIERTGDNKITITPKETAIEDLLKKYADSRRAEEDGVKVTKLRDISRDNKTDDGKS